MKDRFSVGRCCCGTCEDCCSGYAPPEFDVEVEYTDNGCTTCDEDLSGTFTLSRVENQICRWEFYRSLPSWSVPCNSGYTTYEHIVNAQYMRLDVRCLPAWEPGNLPERYRITAEILLASRYETGEEVFSDYGIRPSRRMRRNINTQYARDIPFTAFRCDTANEFELDYDQSSMRAVFDYLVPIEEFGYEFWRPTPVLARGLLGRPIGSVTYTIPALTLRTWTDYPICEPPAKIKITGVP